MTKDFGSARPSLRQKLKIPFLLLVAAPLLLGALVFGASFFNQEKARAIADTFVPFSSATLRASEDTRGLSLILERELSGAELTAARTQSQQQLKSLRENLLKLVRLQQKVDANAPAVDVEETLSVLRGRIDQVISLSEQRQEKEKTVLVALSAAVETSLDAQKLVAPVVQRLAESGQPDALAFHRIETLVEAGGEFRTIAAKLERLAVASTPTELERSKQTAMLDIRNATRLTSRMVDTSTRASFADALSQLFETLNNESGLWASRRQVLALSKDLAKERAAFREQLAEMSEQSRAAAGVANRRLRNAEADQKRLLWATIFGLLLMVVSSVLTARYTFNVVSREILRPVQRLRETTVALSNGDLEIRVDDPQTQELAELADALKGFRESARQLKRSNADLEQFAAVASHDLQSPLRVVANYLGIIEVRIGDKLDDTSRKFFQRAVNGAQRMQRLIEDLLDFSTTGQSKERVFVIETVLETAAANLGLEIGAEMAFEPLPTLRGVQLDRLFSELLKNATKYAGLEERPKIEITAEVVDERIAIRVRDHGIGILPEHRSRVFEIFKRLQPAAEKGGQGIGLAICKRICEANGGEIRVLDTEGKGATFEILLPANRLVSTSTDGAAAS